MKIFTRKQGDFTLESEFKRVSKAKNKNKIKQLSKFLGPAFIVSVAYMDPGNFATNISGGSEFNYSLIWIVLWSNLMAIFLQTLSAKLGIATGKNLPEMCSMVFSKSTNLIFWLVAELGAMATDLAEFLGGTLGIYMLLRVPLIFSGLITALITFFIVYCEKYGQRVIEIIIISFITVICITFFIEVFFAKPNWSQVALKTIIPTIPNKDALLIGVGMLGATVMPHVIYLHSQLVQFRMHNNSYNDKLKHFKLEKIDIILAMNLAFLINVSMIIVAAATFYKNGITISNIESAHNSLSYLLGSISSGVFGLALLSSGLSSSAVGTLAGETIMKGFINLCIPLNIRRLITMAPAIVIISLGISPMNVLIISQIILSFILPFPIIQLLIITRRKDIMGSFANKKLTQIIGIIIASAIIFFNSLLLYFTFI